MSECDPFKCHKSRHINLFVCVCVYHKIEWSTLGFNTMTNEQYCKPYQARVFGVRLKIYSKWAGATTKKKKTNPEKKKNITTI